jgi:hypothetical protein
MIVGKKRRVVEFNSASSIIRGPAHSKVQCPKVIVQCCTSDGIARASGVKQEALLLGLGEPFHQDWRSELLEVCVATNWKCTSHRGLASEFRT